MKKQNIIPILIPNKVYPYNCTYYLKDKKVKNTKDAMKKIIEKHLKEETESDEVEVAFLGKTFTSIDEDKQNELLEIVNEYVKDGKVDTIRILAKPNELTKKRLKIYKKYNVKTIELETISCNDYILKCTKVPYKYKDIKKVARTIRWKGFTLGYKRYKTRKRI